MLSRVLLIVAAVVAAEVLLLVLLVLKAGLLSTFLLVVGAGLIGASIARWQGFQALNTIRIELAAGRTPAAAILDAAMIFIAGLLLILPGLLSDIAGLMLLIPPVRRYLRTHWADYLRVKFDRGVRNYAARASGQGEIIDVEFRRTDVRQIEERP